MTRLSMHTVPLGAYAGSPLMKSARHRVGWWGWEAEPGPFRRLFPAAAAKAAEAAAAAAAADDDSSLATGGVGFNQVWRLIMQIHCLRICLQPGRAAWRERREGGDVTVRPTARVCTVTAKLQAGPPAIMISHGLVPVGVLIVLGLQALRAGREGGPRRGGRRAWPGMPSRSL